MHDTANEIADSTIKAMAQSLETAIMRISGALTRARLDLSYSTYAKQTELLEATLNTLERLKRAQGQALREGIRAMAEHALESAREDMQHLGMSLDQDIIQGFAEGYAKQAHADSFQHVAAMTDRMGQEVKRLLQQDMAQISRRAAVEGLSRKAAYGLLKDSILTKMPSFTFVDRRGRAWGTKDYLEMLTRTTMANTMRDAYAEALTQSGHDLVKVSSHGAKDDCRGREGKVLSLTGATERYPTVEEARATGEVFHPRCRHRLLAYHPASVA